MLLALVDADLSISVGLHIYAIEREHCTAVEPGSNRHMTLANQYDSIGVSVTFGRGITGKGTYSLAVEWLNLP